jgi:glutathione S-transferase
VPIKLYLVHGSHPSAAVARALEMKGLPYRVVELLPPMHAAVQRVRFGARTVPAVRLEDGQRISGSMAIMRKLEELAPAPPLFPADPAARAEVERIERWADEVWQAVARRLLWVAFARSPRAMPSYQEHARLRLPAPVVYAVAPFATFAERKMHDATDERARDDLRALSGHVDRIDGWLAAGVLGDETPNAADLQVATSSRLLLTIGDVRPVFAGRPCEEHALRLFPQWDGSVPAGVLPAEWLQTAAQAA